MKRFLVVFVLFLMIFSFAFGEQMFPNAQLNVAREFMAYLSNGNFSTAEENFAPQMAEALPTQKLEALWETLENKAGKFVQIVNMKAIKSGNYVVVVANTKFQNAYLEFKIVLNNSLQIAGLWVSPGKAPEYTLPGYVNLSKFTVKEITIGKKWKLPAELTIPKGKGPFPAVVLVPGSGPSSMNEKIGPNQPFKDIAYGLSSDGIAVLRYDKRAYVYGMKATPITVENMYLEDASKAVKLMENEPFASKVFVLGHSLGGYLAPEIVKENPKVSGIIMLAAPARPLAKLMIDQLEYILKLSPSSAQKIQKVLNKVKLIEKHQLKGDEFVMGAPASYYYELEKYAPIAILRTLHKPVLICQGGKDYQVTSKDFNMFKKAFEYNSLFTFKWYPNLSHIFTTVEGIPSPLNYETAEHVSQKVIQDLANWIKSH